MLNKLEKKEEEKKEAELKEAELKKAKEKLEEREETPDDSKEPRERAELSGAISLYYLLAMMLLLITGRRKV
ncbi:hypothetical protein ACU6U9_10645 [Pseudomonas sp. HK3]